MSSPQQKQIKTRKEGIMKKAFQLNHMYPDIRIAVIFHIDGKNHIYRSSNTNAWPPSMAEMQSMHPEPENWLNYDFQTAREVVASDGLDPEESIGSSPYIGLGFADTDPVEGDADIVPAHPVAQQNAAKINPYTSSAMHAAVLSGGWNFEEPTSISSSPAPAIAAMPQHQTSTPLSHSVQPSRAVSQTPPVSGAASAIEVQALGNSYNVNSEDIFGDLGNSPNLSAREHVRNPADVQRGGRRRQNMSESPSTRSTKRARTLPATPNYRTRSTSTQLRK